MEVHVFLPSYIVLADLQGSFTFPPQQMLQASTFIRIRSLERLAEMPLMLSVRLSESWNSWDDYGFDGETGAENVLRCLSALDDKYAQLLSDAGCKAQYSSANNQVASNFNNKIR
jgi:hypothetical protein